MTYRPIPLHQMSDEDYVSQQALALVRQLYAKLLDGCRVEDATFLSTSTGAGDSDDNLPTGRVSLRFYLPQFQRAVTTEVDVEDGEVRQPDTFSCGGKTYRTRELDLAVQDLCNEMNERYQDGSSPIKGLTQRNIQKTQATVTYPGPEIYNRGWTDTDRIPVTYGNGKQSSEFALDQQLNETLRAMGGAFRKIAELGKADAASTLLPTPITAKTTAVETFQPWHCYRRTQPVPLQHGSDLGTYPIYITAQSPSLFLHTTQDGKGLMAFHVAVQQTIDAKVLGEYVPTDVETTKDAAKKLSMAILTNAGRYETWASAVRNHQSVPYSLICAPQKPARHMYDTSQSDAPTDVNAVLPHMTSSSSELYASKIHEISGTLESGVITLRTSDLSSMDNTVTQVTVVLFIDVASKAAELARVPLGAYLRSLLGDVTPQDAKQDKRRLPNDVEKDAPSSVHELALAYDAKTTEACLDIFHATEYWTLCDNGVTLQGSHVVFKLLDTLGSFGRSDTQPDERRRTFLIPVETRPIAWLDTPGVMEDALAALLVSKDGYIGYDKKAQTVLRLPDRHAAVDWVAKHTGYGREALDVVAAAERGGFAKIAGTMLSSDVTLVYDVTQNRFAIYTASYGAGSLGSGLGAGGNNVQSGLTEDEVRVYLGNLGVNALGQDTAIRKAKLTGKATVAMNVVSGTSLNPSLSPVTSDVTGALKKLTTNTIIGAAGLGLLDWLGAMAGKHAETLNAGIPKGLPMRGVYQIAKTAADAIPYATPETAPLFEAMAMVLEGTAHSAAVLDVHGELAKTFRKVAASVACAESGC